MTAPPETTWMFNGVHGTGGRYWNLPSAEQILDAIGADSLSADHLEELREWLERLREHPFEVGHGIDPCELDQAGWAAVFPVDSDPGIRDALQPLLDLRREQAGDLYQELTCRPGESKLKFLARHGAGPGPVEPSQVPYYLLIVAGPEEIPFELQYQLDVQYAVGRLHFDSLEEYACYARTVVAAEGGQVHRPRRLSFFGVANPGDRPTERSLEHLVRPLCQALEDPSDRSWAIEQVVADAATKDALAERLGGEVTPALLFSASHGLGFDPGEDAQRSLQGSILCQDWPGLRRWPGAIPREHYFCGDDVASATELAGLVAFFFACFGAGTPRYDAFPKNRSERSEIASESFVAHLPQRLLGHSGGGALAVVGHVERAWSYSFDWPAAGEQTQVFESALRRLVDGFPVGAAVECFGQRYAELATELYELREDLRFGGRPDLISLAGLWTAHNDARSYVVLGDPAVRLAVAGSAASAPTFSTEEKR